MHDTAVPTANFLQDPNERSREAGRASLARLRYDSFQLLSSGTMQTSVNRAKFKRRRSRASAWRLVRPQSA
jgi:hypothetical protein